MAATPQLHVLLVDDDPRFSELIALGLNENGIATTIAENGRSAVEDLCGRPPAGAAKIDVVLLDIMMPEMDGWRVLEEERIRNIDVPILVVTARESVDERVRGLRLGADDYIIKPFAFAELLARIEAVIRRRGAVPNLEFGALHLKPQARQVHYESRSVSLSPREFDVLRVLIENPGQVQSRAQLLEQVWNTTEDPGTNIVEVHVGRVRKKLERVGCHSLATVRGQGYVLKEPFE